MLIWCAVVVGACVHCIANSQRGRGRKTQRGSKRVAAVAAVVVVVLVPWDPAAFPHFRATHAKSGSHWKWRILNETKTTEANAKKKGKTLQKKSNEKRGKARGGKEERGKNYGNSQDTHSCINMHRTHIFSFGCPDFPYTTTNKHTHTHTH